MSHTVFYSWQSDRSTKEGRNLIERALAIAVKRIAGDMELDPSLREELVLDKDTQGIPGSPPIFQTILAKIDAASIFVADLTFCGSRHDSRPTPNPNVLIEYGYALKSLGHHRMLAVMNSAHGSPSRESMPFNLADLRFPITYALPDDAPEELRKNAKDKLANDFEIALKRIVESGEFKAKETRKSELPKFVRMIAQGGKARFRQPTKPLGFVRDSFAQRLGEPAAIPIHLVQGAAIWLRVMPTYEQGRKWRTQELKQPAMRLLTLKMMQNSGNGFGFPEADDGCGYYATYENELTYASTYVFLTGEVWIIVNAKMARVLDYLELDEDSFIKTLEGSASFLDSIGCTNWAVGMERVRGRKLVIPPHRALGQCVTDVIESEGKYEKGDKLE